MPRYTQRTPRSSYHRIGRADNASQESSSLNPIWPNSTPWQEPLVRSVAEAIAIADQITALAAEWQSDNH